MFTLFWVKNTKNQITFFPVGLHTSTSYLVQKLYRKLGWTYFRKCIGNISISLLKLHLTKVDNAWIVSGTIEISHCSWSVTNNRPYWPKPRLTFRLKFDQNSTSFFRKIALFHGSARFLVRNRPVGLSSKIDSDRPFLTDSKHKY